MSLNNTYLLDVMFENEHGKIMKQKVEYEQKPVLCSRCKNFGHDLGECRRKLKEEIRNNEVKKEQQMGNQAPTNEFIKAKEVENMRVQFQQHRRNTTNTRNTFTRLQQDLKVGNKKDEDEHEVNGTQGGTSTFISIVLMLRGLKAFSLSSGLNTNEAKSNIFSANMEHKEVEDLCELTGMKTGR
ncbi:hypothetical protein H5410_052542 [Solanum commersonii]|uniref:DUF4283 domain-containing protein n=1 Tax=Solanum commersonii TaxID=4109 RepID=A0A9J5X1D3_SOLCO|nr:hypothetical protein H5410_052542 [Solanum commersonii]